MQTRADLYLERQPNGSIIARGGSMDGKVFGSSTRSITSPRNERYALRTEAVVYTTSGEKVPVVMLKPSEDENEQPTYDSNDVRESYPASQSPASLLESSEVVNVIDAPFSAGVENVSEGEQVLGLAGELTEVAPEAANGVAVSNGDVALGNDEVVVGVASDTVVSDLLLDEGKPVAKKSKVASKGNKR
jgi:hypothetical protein